jgi:hypothetical protein
MPRGGAKNAPNNRRSAFPTTMRAPAEGIWIIVCFELTITLTFTFDICTIDVRGCRGPRRLCRECRELGGFGNKSGNSRIGHCIIHATPARGPAPPFRASRNNETEWYSPSAIAYMYSALCLATRFPPLESCMSVVGVAVGYGGRESFSIRGEFDEILQEARQMEQPRTRYGIWRDRWPLDGASWRFWMLVVGMSRDVGEQ